MEGAYPTQPSPPPGWYADPSNPALQRYWDGQAWTAHTAPAAGYQAVAAAPPRPLEGLQWLAIVGLAIIALVEVFAIVADINLAQIDGKVIDGERVSLKEIDDAVSMYDATAIAYFVAYLLIGPLTFIPWFHRAYSNLRGFGAVSLRYGTGWAIGAWFIPIFNLWRPKQIANDIDRGSQPGAPLQGYFSNLPVSSLVHWWWGIYLASGFLSGAGSTLVSSANSEPIGRNPLDLAEQERTGALIEAFGSGVAIAAAVLAILVIRRITANQNQVMAGSAQSP